MKKLLLIFVLAISLLSCEKFEETGKCGKIVSVSPIWNSLDNRVHYNLIVQNYDSHNIKYLDLVNAPTGGYNVDDELCLERAW